MDRFLLSETRLRISYPTSISLSTTLVAFFLFHGQYSFLDILHSMLCHSFLFPCLFCAKVFLSTHVSVETIFYHRIWVCNCDRISESKNAEQMETMNKDTENVRSSRKLSVNSAILAWRCQSRLDKLLQLWKCGFHHHHGRFFVCTSCQFLNKL